MYEYVCVVYDELCLSIIANNQIIAAGMNSKGALGVSISEEQNPPPSGFNVPGFKIVKFKIGVVTSVICSGATTIFFSSLPIAKISTLYELITTDRFPTGVIGDGIEGTVMLYKHYETNEIMASKRLKDPVSMVYGLTRGKAREVIQQAELLYQFNDCPWVVPYRDIVVEEMVADHMNQEKRYDCYLIMKFFKDGTLKHLVEARKKTLKHFSTPELARYALQMAKGIEIIHNAGYMHRDLVSAKGKNTQSSS